MNGTDLLQLSLGSPSLSLTADKIMQALPKVTSPNFPEVGNFYDFKRVSVEHIIKHITRSGDWAQFGVYKGQMAREILESLPAETDFHLLDSFEGLPEDWAGYWKAGAFKLDAEDIPVFDDPRVKIHTGWFSDTVPPLARQLTRPLAFLHIDCDLYSSTKDCLWGLNDFIEKDTILLFDEYMINSGKGTDDGEHRALVEWVKKFDRSVELLWRTNWVQVAARVIK